MDTNLPSNLLLLCQRCHARIESHRAEAFELGYLLRQTGWPSLEPVLLDGGWVVLTDDGHYQTIKVEGTG